MYFVLSNNFLVNLFNENNMISTNTFSEPIFMNDVFGIQCTQEQSIDLTDTKNKYKNVNKKKVYESIQNPRCQDTLLTS